MSQEIDRVGTFRGRIVEYGLQEASDTASQSLGIVLRVEIDEAYNFEAEQWEDWKPFQYDARGYVNLVKKDGSANDKSAENLCKCTGWNGSIGDIATGEWRPEAIQFTTKEDSFKDRVSYKIDFINEFNRTPGGGIKNIEPDKAKALQMKYGTTFKALAANVKRNQPPKDKPKSPPPAAVASGDVPFDKF